MESETTISIKNQNSLKLVFDFKNFEDKVILNDEVFVVGRKDTDHATPYVAVFSVDQFNIIFREVIEKNAHNQSYKIIEILDYDEYKPSNDQLQVIGNLPDGELIKVKDFQIIM